MTHLRSTIEELTAKVSDARQKPLLRPVVESELFKLGYEAQDVARELDDFYNVTRQ